MKSSKEIIGESIKFQRNERDFTQQQLADLLGVDRQYVWRIENGKVNMTMDYLDTIIDKMGCSHDNFLMILPVVYKYKKNKESKNSK